MQIQTIITGSIEENCYLVWDNTNHALLIDPGDNPQEILSAIKQHQLSLDTIVLTHGHYDHMGAVNEVKAYTNARVIAHEKEKELLKNPELSLSFYISPSFPIAQVDAYVSHGDFISVGDMKFQVIHTPGHTAGSMCLFSDSVLFSGDTVFYGTLGRWDFPTGNLSDLTHSILQRIFTLPDYVEIYSGHGPVTTVGAEKKQNEVYRWLSI